MSNLTQRYTDTLAEIHHAGLFKSERIIASAQSAEITSTSAPTIISASPTTRH